MLRSPRGRYGSCWAFFRIILTALLLTPGFAANVEIHSSVRSSPALAFSPGIVEALNSQLLALQLAIGNPQLMAQTLSRQVPVEALQPTGFQIDAISAALILKRALTEPEVYSAVQQSLTTLPNPLNQSIAANLAGLEKSIKTIPHAREVFLHNFAPLEEALNANKSLGEISASLDSFFTGSKAPSRHAAVGGVREGAIAPDSFARRHARLTRPEPRAPKAVPAVDDAAQLAQSAEIPASQQVIVDLARKIAPVFNAWLVAPSPEGRQKAYRDFLEIDKELSRAESEEGRRRNLLKKQGQAVIQNETVQNALQEWHRQAWLIREAAAGRSEWGRLLDWPLEPELKKKVFLQLVPRYGYGNQEKASALWQLVAKFNPHGPTDAVLRQNVEALSVRMKSARDAWLNASSPGERPKMQARLKSVNDELDRAEADEIGRQSLREGRNLELEYDEESPSRKIQAEREARNHLVKLTAEPDSVFNRLLELPLGPTQRKEAVQSFVKDENFIPDVGAALVALVQNFKNSGPSNSSASIEELYQSDRWKRRLSAPLDGQTYVRNLRALLSNTSISEYYAVQAAKARDRGEMIVTGGRQATSRQSRGTCPYNAACNLFAEQIAESRLTSKDILREAYRLNPTFASRPGHGVEAVNGLSQKDTIAMTRTLAARVGKQVAEVKPEDLIRFMSAKKTPVMATINSWNEERNQPFDHVVVLGNPFIFHDLSGERSVAFEVYDSNLPKDVVTYIDAETLEDVMVVKGLALVDNH